METRIKLRADLKNKQAKFSYPLPPWAVSSVKSNDFGEKYGAPAKSRCYFEQVTGLTA